MIPILYDKDEVSFTSNGMGRLRDCISCVVTEERNGIFECDFEYPVTGAHYDLIQCGRIIAVQHDENGDIQPFDIVSYSKPIDGIVSFHATHISYRQSFLVAKTSSCDSLLDAFTILYAAEPQNPFHYWSDITSTGFLACADGTPRSVRQILGGVEGSILDTYGGEYKWDKWQVMLYDARGVARDFTIRYGVNMLDYSDELDYSESFTSVMPYWTDGNQFVVGNRVDSGMPSYTGRDECVPLDVSDKFESKPTKAQVESMASSMIGDAYLPQQTVTVEFARLQDLGYKDLENLYKCNLCDTVNVVFPRYGMQGNFKIVKTVWDVLQDRYESMELGSLSTTLSEALGVEGGSTIISGGGGGGGVTDVKVNGTSVLAGTVANVPLVGAQGTVGVVKNGSSTTSTSGLTASPIISGIPYYKDTTYTAATTASAVSTTSSGGSASTYSKGDHVHSISLATGDSSGQVKIAGTNVAVKDAVVASSTTTNNYLAKFTGDKTVANGPQIGSDTTKYLRNDGTWQVPPDTKNTAGSTDSDKRLYVIGATSQTANPQTYSNALVYIGIDDCLYSNGTKVLTAHQTYTSYTGKPTADQTPGFGDTVTVSQISQNTSGQVSGTDRTITIPDATATTTSAGLMSATDKINLNSAVKAITSWTITAGNTSVSTTVADSLYRGCSAWMNGEEVVVDAKSSGGIMVFSIAEAQAYPITIFIYKNSL